MRPTTGRPSAVVRAANLFLVTSILVFMHSGDRVNPAAGVSAPRLRISILSKHLRLLKEGTLQSLIMKFPPDTIMDSGPDISAVHVDTIAIGFRDAVSMITAGDRVYPLRGTMRIRISGNAPTFDVSLENETRTYPLPLEIIADGENLSLVVSEDLDRYCMDSSRAEYGAVPLNRSEALYALALIIRARYGFPAPHRIHKDFDFCDLTHCQVYRGRSKSGDGITPGSPWIIANDRMKEVPFFHSRCGGVTLGSGVFSLRNQLAWGVRDWISSEGVYLCRGPGTEWERTLNRADLASVLKEPWMLQGASFTLSRDPEHPAVIIKSGDRSHVYALEDFRLKINRVRGWNFLKSNSYSVRMDMDRGPLIHFKGYGLGHGAGLCQHGALELARRGYTRYEILGHYFPGITFNRVCPDTEAPPFDLAYAVFSLRTGACLQISHRAFLSRKLPAGSFFKICIALYCGMEREDLLREHVYTCRGRHGDPELMPEKCWKPEGHGRLNFPGALSHSCNLYFASLGRHLAPGRLNRFMREMSAALGIGAGLPATADQREFTRLLSGTDFRIVFSVKELMTLARLLGPVQTEDRGIESYRRKMSPDLRSMLAEALAGTVREGTASLPLKPYGPEGNYDLLFSHLSAGKNDGENTPGKLLWGKTSTVVTGTNTHTGYGLFLGGNDEYGIVTVLRRGNGHIAAQWARYLLERFMREKEARPDQRKKINFPPRTVDN